MIFSFFTSLFENIKERTKNPYTERNKTPFAGAFIIAVILYNWKLFYSLISFDSSATRTDKIGIISAYLTEMDWKCRLGIPILLAFGSILFFYIFNIISLGISTFFNRWGKATILHYTDRSKIITRQEYEMAMNKMHSLRTKHEDLKRNFSESQSDLEELKKQNNFKDEEMNKIILDREKINNELISLNDILQGKDKVLSELTENAKNIAKELKKSEKEYFSLVREGLEFKILFARYGKNNNYYVVTDKVADLIRSNNKIDVKNLTFGGDPLLNVRKELLIVYSANGNVTHLTAQEHDIVAKENNELVTIFKTV
jgi:hypothetical protein